jgi:ribonuclease P protein component
VKRHERLRTPAEFAAARDRAGRAWPHRLLVLYVAPNDLGYARAGITVSGRVGKAVVRNRVRRRLRELLSARLPLLDSKDVLLIARPAAAGATWPELAQALGTLMNHAGAPNDRVTTV